MTIARMSLIKYHYAYDESKQIININDVSSTERANHSYYCVGCGAEMVSRLGSIKVHHLAHKVANRACGWETYIHRLAKQTIKNKFDSCKEFLITYYQKVKCDKSGRCYLKEECYNDIQVTFDLKKYYDQCLLESPIQGFVADVLFFNSTKLYDPVLIEIQVSHKCTATKKQSGLKIIEIEVNNEEDITMLAQSSIVESFNSGSIPLTSFYGFVRNAKETKPMEMRFINRFYLYDNYSVYVDSVSCRYAENKSDKRTLLELGFSSYYYGFAKALDLGSKLDLAQYANMWHIMMLRESIYVNCIKNSLRQCVLSPNSL